MYRPSSDYFLKNFCYSVAYAVFYNLISLNSGYLLRLETFYDYIIYYYLL